MAIAIGCWLVRPRGSSCGLTQTTNETVLPVQVGTNEQETQRETNAACYLVGHDGKHLPVGTTS